MAQRLKVPPAGLGCYCCDKLPQTNLGRVGMIWFMLLVIIKESQGGRQTFKVGTWRQGPQTDTTQQLEYTTQDHLPSQGWHCQ